MAINCPAEACSFQSDSEVGLSIHWGRTKDGMHTGKLRDLDGFNPTRPEETRKRMGRAKKKKWWDSMTSEERADMSLKISEAISGRTLSEEHKEKMAARMRGEKNPNWGGLSEEHRKNVSEAILELSKDPGHLKKLSEAQKKRWREMPEERERYSDMFYDWWGSLSESERDEIVQKRSESISRAWADASEEEYEEWCDNISEGQRGRKPNRVPKRLYSEELGHGTRSSWEEEVAHILSSCGIDYEYEPRRFKVFDDGTSVWPDFIVGDVVLEVKGYADELSCQKAAEFVERYPEYTYVVVGSKMPCDFHIPWDECSCLPAFLSDHLARTEAETAKGEDQHN